MKEETIVVKRGAIRRKRLFVKRERERRGLREMERLIRGVIIERMIEAS